MVWRVLSPIAWVVYLQVVNCAVIESLGRRSRLVVPGVTMVWSHTSGIPLLNRATACPEVARLRCGLAPEQCPLQFLTAVRRAAPARAPRRTDHPSGRPAPLRGSCDGKGPPVSRSPPGRFRAWCAKTFWFSATPHFNARQVPPGGVLKQAPRTRSCSEWYDCRYGTHHTF